jgi:predicted exporter
MAVTLAGKAGKRREKGDITMIGILTIIGIILSIVLIYIIIEVVIGMGDFRIGILHLFGG